MFGLSRSGMWLVVGVISVACLPSATVAAEGKPLTFEGDIRPIFRSHCYDCHGAEKQKKGKLDLRLARLMRVGGETGPAIVAGDPGKSFLVKRLREGSMRSNRLARGDTASSFGYRLLIRASDTGLGVL